MPTIAGLIFIGAAVYFASRGAAAFFGLLIFSAIFPATSVMNFGSLWIMPYYLLAPIFIALQFRSAGMDMYRTHFRGRNLLICFTLFGVFSALVYPVVFSGIQVYSPRLGSSDETFYTFPLTFSIANLAQAAYLVVNALVLFAAASLPKSPRLEQQICNSITAAFYFLTGTIGAELICIILGVAFPYQIFENGPVSPHFDLDLSSPAQRMHGTCGEPSYAGLILVGYFAAYFYRYYSGKGTSLKALIAAVAIFLIHSSSAILAMVAVGVMIVVANSPIRFPGLLNVRRSFRLAPVLVLGAISLTIPAVISVLQKWIFNKQDTGSFINRTTMDLYSYKILTDTYGIGVGLGSYRPSSLATSALGNLGLFGAILFFVLLVALSNGELQERRWMKWAVFAAVLDMCVAIPDITHPILWSFLALAVSLGQKKQENRSFRLKQAEM